MDGGEVEGVSFALFELPDLVVRVGSNTNVYIIQIRLEVPLPSRGHLYRRFSVVSELVPVLYEGALAQHAASRVRRSNRFHVSR